jgi:hypothetical protein
MARNSSLAALKFPSEANLCEMSEKLTACPREEIEQQRERVQVVVSLRTMVGVG